MSTTNRFAEIAALAGEPTRAVMLHALMDARALTASELARHAGVTPQTASGHLARLAAAGLVSVAAQGRHRYHQLASPEVAAMLESIMQVAAITGPATGPRVGPADPRMRAARTCYDHLAGRLGVALADALQAARYIEFDDGAGSLTPAGTRFLTDLNIMPLATNAAGRRVLCRPCLDWSERRPHLAGRLGKALCDYAFQKGWVRRLPDSRALVVTPRGAAGFRDTFAVAMPPLSDTPHGTQR